MVNWFWRKKKPEETPAPTAAPLPPVADTAPAATAEPSPEALPLAVDMPAPDTPPHTDPVAVPPSLPQDLAAEPAPPAITTPAPAAQDDAADPAAALAREFAAAFDAAARRKEAEEADYAHAAPAASAGKLGWRERLRGSSFARSLGGLFSRNPKLDDSLLEEIETALLMADVGIKATESLVSGLGNRMKQREFADAAGLLAALRQELVALLRPVAVPLAITPAQPFVIVTVGVNGVGKTTTIGKLARRFRDENRSLMLAAGDTFRAAAVAQLQAWGERNGVAVIAQGQDADAAAVAFDAYASAKARGTDILIADTAGRLHTQGGLMNELEKIIRVLKKHSPDVPHEVLMVIDGTTGQNAIAQVRAFSAKVPVSGLVVTKLDGTAKGGVVFALAREFGIPIRFAGIGERPEDLRVFDPEAFVDALLPESLGTAAAQEAGAALLPHE